MRFGTIVDEYFIPILTTAGAALLAVVAYVVIAGVVTFGIITGAALAGMLFGFDLFAWIGGL